MKTEFCFLAEYPSAPYDQLFRQAGVEGLPPCPEPRKLPGDPCRPNQKPIAFRSSAVSKMQQTGIGGTNGESKGSMWINSVLGFRFLRNVSNRIRWWALEHLTASSNI